MEAFDFDDGAFVRAAADLAALIVGGNLKHKQLPFPSRVTCGGCDQYPGRRRRTVSYVNCHADRQLAWTKQRLQSARGCRLHERYHSRRRKHRGKRIAIFRRKRARKIVWTNDELRRSRSIDFKFRHVAFKIT